MITVGGLIRTLSLVKNPYSIISLKVRKKRTNVTFPNGAEFKITWSQFRFLRDNYNLVKKYNLEQIDDYSFKIHTEHFQLVGSQVLICILNEIESGIYNYDYRDKVVLDIGGFEGESAVLFWVMGAKKVVIYEPVLEHQRFIEENVQLNKINAEIHYEGIGEKDGELTIAYNKADNCFGLQTEDLSHKMTIKIRDTSKIITESGAEVAKIDCEGAEISLVKVPREILRKLEYVIVEVHTPQLRETVIEKFKDSGFILAKDGDKAEEQISIVCFKRI